MKLLIAVPSFNRPYDIEKNTLFWLKKIKEYDWRIFIRVEQLKYYSQTVPLKNIVVIKVKTFGETINAIQAFALENNYDLIHKIDDDMSFKDRTHSKKPFVHLAYLKAAKEIVAEFENVPELGGVSIIKPMPFFYNKKGNWVRENKALLGNQFLRPEFMFMPKGIELFDDIYNSLSIRKARSVIRGYAGCYENAVILKNKGGLQSIDRNAASKRTLTKMAKLFPCIKLGCYKGDESIVDVDFKSLNEYLKVGGI